MNSNVKELICKIQELCYDNNCHDESLDVYDITKNARVLYNILGQYLEEIGKETEPNQGEIKKVLYDRMING